MYFVSASILPYGCHDKLKKCIKPSDNRAERPRLEEEKEKGMVYISRDADAEIDTFLGSDDAEDYEDDEETEDDDAEMNDDNDQDDEKSVQTFNLIRDEEQRKNLTSNYLEVYNLHLAKGETKIKCKGEIVYEKKIGYSHKHTIRNNPNHFWHCLWIPCGRTYKKADTLWEHIKRHVYGEKAFRCFCGQVYNSLGSTRTHINNVHHGYSYACGKCNKTFGNKTSARRCCEGAGGAKTLN